jgi:hypothetical protein
MIGIYRNDPTRSTAPTRFAKAALTPDGPGTICLSWDNSGDVTAEAWGDGAEWLLNRAPHWVGLNDDIAGSDPALHPCIASTSNGAEPKRFCWQRCAPIGSKRQ